jgi:hypothetical protein
MRAPSGAAARSLTRLSSPHRLASCYGRRSPPPLQSSRPPAAPRGRLFDKRRRWRPESCMRGLPIAVGLLLTASLAAAQSPPEAPSQEPDPAASAGAVSAETAAPAPTQATFVSATSEGWNVIVDDEPICSTPCSGPLQPWQFVVLSSQDTRPVLLEVGRLPPGRLLVSGKPLSHGMYAGGIVATTFAGMAMAVGITLTAVGFARDRSGMATAGLITSAAGAVLLPSGIYLMVKALPRARVEHAAPGMTGIAAGLAASF